MIPVKIKGHPYIISTDEAGGAGGAGGWAAACARGASAWLVMSSADSARRYDGLQAAIGYRFKTEALCETALTTVSLVLFSVVTAGLIGMIISVLLTL